MVDVKGCAPDNHHYYVADVAVDEGSGAVTVIIVCTACGKFLSKSFQVTNPNTKE